MYDTHLSNKTLKSRFTYLNKYSLVELTTELSKNAEELVEDFFEKS